jgi:hypothetical protein
MKRPNRWRRSQRPGKFPLPHVILEDKKEVWIRCTSAITAMGISAMMERHYPGYKGHIASESYFEELKRSNQ